ncbi:MAG: DEAD/DEAH box helicase [Treponema sp.]|nr:DEAD/DEAH box helicase [Treponema sp.]
MSAVPSSFHPIIRSWFAETYRKPTAVQEQAWPLIEQGRNVLALAPTGSGKTLTAFLSAISRFCPGEGNTEPYPADKLTVLYVSPLKALNEDIKRNLLEPLAAIRLRFEQAGLSFPAIRVETRSGDTPQSQRRRFLAHPPSILALTPESLAILLLSPKGRQVLSTVQYLILDEIHAVLGNKRGAFLSCQIDRLALTADEFQRISLSATIRSPEIAASFVAGKAADDKKREVSIVAPPAEKQIDLTIAFPDAVHNFDRIDQYGKRYTGLINYILNRISERSTILVFTDSRRRAERLCFFINREAASLHDGNIVAFTHHGSLSKELRQSVERRLAAGELPCVVATASLELGIDIGSVDEVVLAGSPSSVSQALQRIGRSGHGVGQISRGRLFPFHGMDLLQAIALKGAVADRDIEELHPIENPLDILAQMILALCVEKNRNIDELYHVLKGFYLFRNLNRESYMRTVRMLAGLVSAAAGETGRLREIKPRIWLDAIAGEIGALDGSLLLLYSSGGVITNRGMYSLRLADGTKIGELDEEFVWERRIGDHFHFGGRGWRINGIDAESVQTVPLENSSDYIPFWRADAVFRSPNLTERILEILDNHNAAHTNTALSLTRENGEASAALAAFLDSQRGTQNGLPLSGSTGITVEIIDSPETRGDFYAVVIHSFRGGAVNYPLTLALSQELEERIKLRVESFSNDDALLFLIPRLGLAEGGISQMEEMIRSAFVTLNSSSSGDLCRGERLFRNRLEASGIFGASFREAAERCLLLPKAGFGKRTPLWIMRQRSKRLFDAVCTNDGFPVTAEAWRSCLVDMFDMDGFRELLSAINDGGITLSFFRTAIPSPFSRDLVRQETNALMYDYDERKGLSGASLSDKVIEEALGDAALRPVLKQELLDSFSARLRRELPGWTPEDALSLCEWVKERIAIPLDEWETLCANLPEKLKLEISPQGGDDIPQQIAEHLSSRLLIIKRNETAIASVVHREWETAWKDECFANDNWRTNESWRTLLGPWLRYEGPVSLQRITEVFGISLSAAEDAVNTLVEVDEIVSDVLVENGEKCICDRENLEMLLRLSRRKFRTEIREKSAALIIPFLALRQGLAGSRSGGSGDAVFLTKLTACSAPAKLWETEFCTARCGNYSPDIIDREISEGRLAWYGAGRERIGLCRPEDLDLVFTDTEQQHKAVSTPHGVFFAQAIQSGFFDRPRDFWEIKDAAAAFPDIQPGTVRSTDLAKALWQEVWQGRLSSDSLEPVRQGIKSGFVPKDPQTDELTRRPAVSGPRHPEAARFQRIPRSLRDRWKSGAPVRGRWFSLLPDDAQIANSGAQDIVPDPLDRESRNRECVRLLLARWGILCRPLLERVSRDEPSPFSWSGLLPTMRRMELAGELVAGRFFAGINSLQFASPVIARELANAESFDGIYWMNAADPASPAGLEIEGLDPRLPARLPSSRVYFRGAQLIAVSNRNGKEQQIFISPEDSSIAALIDFLKIPRSRKVLPEKKILVETINNSEAARSDYAPAFVAAGFVSDRGRLCFW